MDSELRATNRQDPYYKDLVVESGSNFRIRTKIYTDPQIFESEKRNIFEKTWVYVGHESEITDPGDYLTTYIGGHPVIVSRSQDDQIHVLLNVCRHRGNVICRQERGHSGSFRCSFHGWVYANDGALVKIPESGGYPADFQTETLGLVHVPRVAVYRELIFASLSEGGSLEEYLGEVKRYIDLWVERSPEGIVRVLSPYKHSYPGNWKFQVEQDVDGYHGAYVHESAFKTKQQFYGTAFGKDRKAAVHGTGRTLGFPGGHCILEKPGNRGELPPEVLKDYMNGLVGRYGAERAEEITMVRHLFIFPNLYLMDNEIRINRPISVDKTEMVIHPVVLQGAAESVNKGRNENLRWRHSPGGFIGSDDIEMYMGCQTGMQASRMEWIVLDRGLHREVLRPNGVREGHSSDETPQRNIYRHWIRLISDTSS